MLSNIERIIKSRKLWQLEQLERLRSEIPHAAPWLPILVIHIRSQVKITQSQSYKLLKKIAKTSNFKILQETLHTTHLLELLDKMYKYEMDPSRTVQATERTRDAGRMRDGRTDGWSDGRMEWNQYTPQQLCLAGGIITILMCYTWCNIFVFIHCLVQYISHFAIWDLCMYNNIRCIFE